MRDVAAALLWLEQSGSKEQIAELDRYGIVAERPYGVAVGELKRYAKAIGRDHQLALALWHAERYEARMLAVFVDEPSEVTVRQMNAWVGDCDNWALVDTLCFHLFDRAEAAWTRPALWAKAAGEFKKRAAFAMIWALALHDKEAEDAAFIAALPLMEATATDGRKHVKKCQSMALRAIGKRNPTLRRGVLAVARRLLRSHDDAARWIGRQVENALR